MRFLSFHYKLQLIYIFSTFSEYNGREDPARDEISKPIPFNSTTKYRPKNHSLKNHDNYLNNFQSYLQYYSPIFFIVTSLNLY